MKQIFSESKLKSVIGYKEPIGKGILKLRAYWIKQLHTQILFFLEKCRKIAQKRCSIQTASDLKILLLTGSLYPITN